MKKVLLIGGSLNQTRMVHAVAQQLETYCECWFTPYYADGLMQFLAERGRLDFTALGGRHRRDTDAYLQQHGLKLDVGGRLHDYNLAVTASDLVIQQNIRDKPIILIQEGITDPINWRYHLVMKLGLPRYLAGTAANGLSDAYRCFCVASPGYKKFFAGNGANPDKILVTGIPNFDNVHSFVDNAFPYRNYALVATTCVRETFRRDDRRAFIKSAMDKAQGKRLIFKLHPNEDCRRAACEIKALLPDALIFSSGDIGPMIANCDILITQYSSVAFIGLALGKEVHSYFDLEALRELTPLQNGGSSARHIAEVCLRVLEAGSVEVQHQPGKISALAEQPMAATS